MLRARLAPVTSYTVVVESLVNGPLRASAPKAVTRPTKLPPAIASSTRWYTRRPGPTSTSATAAFPCRPLLRHRRRHTDLKSVVRNEAPRNLRAVGIDDAEVGESRSGMREQQAVGLEPDSAAGDRFRKDTRVLEVALLDTGPERGRREHRDKLHALSPSFLIRWYANAPASSSSPSATNESTR